MIGMVFAATLTR